MEFLFYFLCGILYAELILIYICLIVGITYLAIKSTFCIFDKLGMEHPAVTVYEFIKKQIDLIKPILSHFNSVPDKIPHQITKD